MRSMALKIVMKVVDREREREREREERETLKSP